MSNLTMPNITISFSTAARSFPERGDRGTVLLLLRDSTASVLGKHYVLLSPDEAPAALSAANRAQISRCFLGNVNAPKKVLVFVFGGTGTGAVSLQDALDWAATQRFDWMAGPDDISASECATVATWIGTQRSNSHAVCKAVLPNHTGNSEAIVNFTGAGIDIGGDSTLSAGDYCSRIAGILAGTPLRISATYTPLPEVADVTRQTPAQLDTAVAAGKLVLWYDGSGVRLGRAVNSLTTTTDAKNDSFKKIKLVSTVDQISRDLRELIVGEYVGKFPNNYDNKLVLITAIRDYLQALADEGVLADGFSVELDEEAQRNWLTAHGYDVTAMTDREIREANTGSEVFLYAVLRPLDAIEDVTLNINI